MALRAGLVVSVDNMLDWEEMRDKAGEVIVMRTYVHVIRPPVKLSTDAALISSIISYA
jgi:hypothetical protein